MGGARNACEEGIKLFCSDELKKKLRYNLEKCDEAPDSESKAPKPVAELATAAKPKATRSKLDKGFLDASKGDLYGPEGSKQGVMPRFYKQPINGGEAVIDVPINRDDCAKMNLIPMPDMPDPLDEAADDSGCILKDC